MNSIVAARAYYPCWRRGSRGDVWVVYGLCTLVPRGSAAPSRNGGSTSRGCLGVIRSRIRFRGTGFGRSRSWLRAGVYLIHMGNSRDLALSSFHMSIKKPTSRFRPEPRAQR